MECNSNWFCRLGKTIFGRCFEPNRSSVPIKNCEPWTLNNQMHGGLSQSGVQGFLWVLIVCCWLVLLAQILWNWLIWHLLYPGLSKQPGHRICAGYFLFLNLLMRNPFFFTNIIMTWSDLWGTKWTRLCCFLYICLQQNAWREHTFSYPEATLLLVSTKKFQEIPKKPPRRSGTGFLGIWSFCNFNFCHSRLL